jgi:hypothetical protein
VRFKQTKNIENLKTDLTTSLHPSIGPFRHIYTPAGGTEVTSLDQIEKDKEYVAGQGNQNFRKLSQVIHKNGQKGKKKSSVTSIASSSNQVSISRSRAFISHGLYIFYPIFQCSSYCRVVSTKDNLCTKKRKFFDFLGLKSAVYNQERLIIKSRL